MKKTILSALALIIFSASFGQNEYRKLPSLGIYFVYQDFNTAKNIRDLGLTDVIRDNKLFNFKQMAPGLGISYSEGITEHIDFSLGLSANFLKYPFEDGQKTKDAFLFELAGTANIKLLNDDHIFNPFATVGIGASKFGGYYGAFTPVGVGLQIQPYKDVFIVLNSQYRIPVTTNVTHHFYHSVGVNVALKDRKPAPVIVPPVIVLDRDGDGIVDSLDRCPDTPGLAVLNGCPDKDSDGIADVDDKCPEVPGLAKYQGCPIPDTDGDGINDEEDKCPTVAGVARYQGCPVPDTDGDGLNDEEDKCPTRPGPVENQGCPVIAKEVIEKINFAAKNVFYSTGSFKLLPKSFKSLDEVARLMKEDPSLILNIDGHTDSQGSDESNQVLSENRAKSVKDYLMKKGVEENRLIATGYGETKPIADNKTAAGRAKNRRTEMTVRNF